MTPFRRRVEWRDVHEKAQWIDGECYLYARLPLVRELGARFACARDSNDREGLARDLHRFVRDSVRYVPDPFYEEISDAQTILERGYGDCDDKVVAFVSLGRSVGLESRVRPVLDPEGYFYHVQAEVCWPGSESFAYAQPRGWVLAELILRGCELGQSPHTLPQSSYGSRVLQ